MTDTERLATDRAYWDSVAPEGATHYQPQQQMFYKRNGKDNWRVYSNRWWKSPATSDSALWVKRPKQWIDGLPPVGVECECLFNDGWVKVLVLSVNGDEAWVKRPRGSHIVSEGLGNEFRPIRTPGQRERDDVVDFTAREYLSKRLESDPNLSGEQARKIAAALYDAGMLQISSNHKGQTPEQRERQSVIEQAFSKLSEFHDADQVLGELYDAGMLHKQED